MRIPGQVEPTLGQMGINNENEKVYKPVNFEVKKSGKGSGFTVNGDAGRYLEMTSGDIQDFTEALKILDRSDAFYIVGKTQEEADSRALELQQKINNPDWQLSIIESARKVSSLETEIARIKDNVNMDVGYDT